MKLKTFNTANVRSMRSEMQKPYIQMNSKTGLVNINAAAAAAIGLKDGDQVQLLQNEEEETEWFLEKVKKDGFVIRYKETVGKGFLFNSTKLVRLVFDSVAYVGTGGRVYVGELVKVDKQNLFTLITAKLLNG